MAPIMSRENRTASFFMHNRKDSKDTSDWTHISTTNAQFPNFKPIIAHDAHVKKSAESPIAFSPEKHLACDGPVNTLPMSELGFDKDLGVSPVAVSEPFKLFSDEAIEQMRAEIFQPEVMENCCVRSNIAACQIRGWAVKYGRFTYDAWTHPETLAIMSRVAGVDLVPQFDYDIAHINFSVKSDEQTAEERTQINQRKQFEADPANAGRPWEDDKPVVGWHTDSYPFVCVLMLSDCTNMVGGETALRTANGDILKVRGPQKGCAVILQGRYITHQALRALGSQERITAVTSFRPRSAMLKDDTVLTTVRPVSDLNELYFDFAEYRLRNAEERIRKAHQDMVAARLAGKKFDTLAHKKFLEETIAFMAHSNNEIVEESKVVRGHIDEKE